MLAQTLQQSTFSFINGVRPRLGRVSASLALSLTSLAQAAQLHPEAAPALAPAAAPSLMGLMQVMFSLLLVLGAIFVTAFVLRRFGPGQVGGNNQMRVVAGVMVGAKERVVIVEVKDTWLVLGVTATKVSTLHSLPKPEGADAPQAAVPFAEKLAAALMSRRKPEGEDA